MNYWLIHLFLHSLPPSFTYLTDTRRVPIVHSLDKHAPRTTLVTFYRANGFDSKKAHLRHRKHCPRGRHVILRPHTQSPVIREPAPLHPRRPCCNNHSIPIVSKHLSSLSSPANYTLTPCQISKLRFALNCSDNSPSIEAETECILMRCIIAQHNAFLFTTILWFSSAIHLPAIFPP